MHQKFLATGILEEMYMSYYGKQACPPGQCYGPAVRDHYLYVFVVRGKGVYQAGGASYTLTKGQAFVLFPGELTRYQADEQQPWEYMWFGFGGKQAGRFMERSGVSLRNPVITHLRPDRMLQCLEELTTYAEVNETADELFYSACLSAMLSEICRNAALCGPAAGWRRSPSYVEQAKQFMERHYDKAIRMDDVAGHVGLERSYFSKLFKAEAGLSPYRYMMELRVARSKQLLVDTRLPVEHIGLLVGFKDTFHFSSFFKKNTGLPPLQYRRRFTPMA